MNFVPEPLELLDRQGFRTVLVVLIVLVRALLLENFTVGQLVARMEPSKAT